MKTKEILLKNLDLFNTLLNEEEDNDSRRCIQETIKEINNKLDFYEEGRASAFEEEIKWLKEQIEGIELEIKYAEKVNNSIAEQSVIIFRMWKIKLNKRLKQKLQEAKKQ